MLRSVKFLLTLVGVFALTVGAQAQVLRSATDRAAQIYWYQQTLNERASKEARELARVLGLNESEMQLVRQFAAARLQAENEAQAGIINDPAERREAQERASAQFQTRLVNALTESQMQRYFQLLAETNAAPKPEASTVSLADEVVPAIKVAASGQEAAPAADAPAPAKPAVTKSKRRYTPIGAYHRRPVRRR